MTYNKEIMRYKKGQRVLWKDRPGAISWPGLVEHVSLDYVELKLDTPEGQGDVFVLALPHELEITT